MLRTKNSVVISLQGGEVKEKGKVVPNGPTGAGLKEGSASYLEVTAAAAARIAFVVLTAFPQVADPAAAAAAAERDESDLF